MTVNSEVEAKAKNKTVEQIKSEQLEEGDDEEEEQKEGEGEGEGDELKRPDDRYPSFMELFAN